MVVFLLKIHRLSRLLFLPGEEEVHAFEIDSEIPNGRVAIMYRGGHQKPQVWF